MIDVETQIGYSLLNQGSRLEDFQFVVEEAGEVDGGQLHDIRHGGAGLAPVIVLFLNQDFRTAAIHRGAVADIHIGAEQAEDDTDYKPGPVGQVLEEDFVEIEFLFGLLFSSFEGGILLGHISRYYYFKTRKVTKILIKETKIEVPLNHNEVL
jgi:hypothetical protein